MKTGPNAYKQRSSPGDNFKPNNVVKKLQGDLITTNFLPQGSDDGFFGDELRTKRSMIFKDYAIKLVRMKSGKRWGKRNNTEHGPRPGVAGRHRSGEKDPAATNLTNGFSNELDKAHAHASA